MLEEGELAYAAGFLDGEGCFVVGANHKITIVAANTYRPVIDWLQATFGGSVSVCKGKKANHRTTYRWCVVSRDAMRACQTLAPYLREKAAQAMLLIAIQQTIGFDRRSTKMIPVEVIEERNRLAELVKAEKGRIAT